MKSHAQQSTKGQDKIKMRIQNTNLNRTFALCSLLFAMTIGIADAAVVSRSRRPSNASRMPTMTATIQNTATSDSKTETTVTEPEPTFALEPDPAPEEIITDKSSQFDEFMADNATTTDTSASTLAEQIRAQRAALDAADSATAINSLTANARATGKNACDANLRACMQEKCGKDYSKCAGDTDTMWGTKMDACRRDLPCSGTEYAIFTREIKADRDMNARIVSYNAIIDCGNRYNDCIVTECGQKFTKCLGKRAGDAAISKCEKIAKNCTHQDSGLASRTMNVFGTLRVDAEKQVVADEQRLYDMRDKMRDTCNRLGAMFDERTLDCVYTVNFFAGDDNTLYASKKAYAGSTFSCDQNWFGVDITTFKENAFRLTRAQKSATSALMGSGVGMAVGAVTSGAIDRAIDRHKAEKAVKDAESEHDELYGDGESDKKSKGTKKEKNKKTSDDNKPGAAQKRCERAGGKWNNGTCSNPDCGNKVWDSTQNKCVKPAKAKDNKESGDATATSAKPNAEPVISDEARARIDAELTAKPTVKPMEITKPTATATSAKPNAEPVISDEARARIDASLSAKPTVKATELPKVDTSTEKKNEEITDAPCAKDILTMTDDERELCKSHMERQYPILDDAKCPYRGTNYACRASYALIEKIDEFRELCDEYNGDYTADITKGTITQDVPWPWNYGYYDSVWRCENLTDEDFAEFRADYEDITDYLFTSTAEAAELGLDNTDNTVTMSDWDNNVIIDMGQKS